MPAPDLVPRDPEVQSPLRPRHLSPRRSPSRHLGHVVQVSIVFSQQALFPILNAVFEIRHYWQKPIFLWKFIKQQLPLKPLPLRYDSFDHDSNFG